MSVRVEQLLTSAMGLHVSWVVEDVKPDTAKRRADLKIGCHDEGMACPICNAATLPSHDRLCRNRPGHAATAKDRFDPAVRGMTNYRSDGLHTIGPRYFNAVGSRNDAHRAYANVSPKWMTSLLKRETVFIKDDGEAIRDFCFLVNAAQANMLAATMTQTKERTQVFNLASGDRTTLKDRFRVIRDAMMSYRNAPASAFIHCYLSARDVSRSLADVSKRRRLLGYESMHRLADGKKIPMPWHVSQQVT